jgi:hypothetical protein
MKHLKLFESFSEDWKSKSIEIRMKYLEDKKEWVDSIKKSLLESMNNVCDDYDYQFNTIISPKTDEEEDERLEDSIFLFKFNVSIVPEEFEKFANSLKDSILETRDRLEVGFYLSDFLIKRGTNTISKKYASVINFNISHEEYLDRWLSSVIEQLKQGNVLDIYPDLRGELTVNFCL